MESVKKDDIITANDGELKERVIARADDIIWTRGILERGAVTNIQGPFEIDDLVTFGWTIEAE